MKKRSKKQSHDVYVASDPDEDEKKVNAHRGGGGGAAGRTLDNVENYDFSVNEIVDDEEIDEDGAFNDSDNEKYGAYFENNDENDDDASESEDDADMVDLSEMLNDGDNSLEIKDPTFKGLLNMEESEVDLIDDELQSLTESEAFSDSSNDLPENENQFASFIESLDKKPERKRKRTKERTEAYEESEFALPSRFKLKTIVDEQDNITISSRKSQLNDMMNSISEETGFGGLKKQLASLENTKDASKIATALSAPLPKRIQDKFHREAAYVESKKSVSKWIPLVKKNRESEHLSFPMNALPAVTMSNGAMVGQFQPSTDMEKEIQLLLDQSALTENKIQNLESLELNKISKEELLERRAELGKIRSLLFFKEQKQKKISKIKSKIYRKVHRKNKDNDNIELDLDELKRLDPEAAREKIEQLEAERARERVSLKHKNTGKWAKQMLNKKDGDVETRMALIAQLDKHQELKKRIQGFNSDDSDQDDLNEADQNMDEVEAGLLKLDNLEKDINQSENAPTKGLFAMKFMQKAIDKQKTESLQMIKNAKLKIQNDDYQSSDSENENDEPKEISGRRIYGQDNEDSVSLDEFDSDEEELNAQDGPLQIKSSGPLTIDRVKPLNPLFNVEPFFVGEAKESVFKGTVNESIALPESIQDSGEDSEESQTDEEVSKENEPSPSDESESEYDATINPWISTENLGPLQKSNKLSKFKNSTASSIDKTASKFLKQKNMIIQAPLDSGELDIEVSDNLLTTFVESENQPEQPKQTPISPPKTIDYSSSDSDSQVDNSEFKMIHSADLKKLSQLDIMKMTFENDDLVADFELEKNNEIEKDLPKEKDITLPGWGSWGGNGSRPQKFKKIVKQVGGIDVEKRQDSKLRNVIINEKRPKKSLQYLVPNVPHGFENKDQYERIIRTPVGKEWNSQGVYRENVKPKVQTKLGTIINPLKFTSQPKKSKSQPPRSNKKL